jgi:hypothetical protein
MEEPQPSIIPSPNRIIVIGDIHGDLFRLMKCLYNLKIITPNLEWIAEPKNTVIVQVGDQVDSLSRGGQDNWENLPDLEVVIMMDRLDHIAKRHGGRVISLFGNHELMNMMKNFEYVSKNSIDKLGDHTTRFQLFQPGSSIMNILMKRNVVVKVGPFLFCHGGILPDHLNMVNNNIEYLNYIMHTFCRNEPLTPTDTNILEKVILDPTGILWTRSYIELNPEILEYIIDEVCLKTQTFAIFVGHNTMPVITKACNGKLYFTDAGFSRAFDIQSSHVEIINILKNENIYNIEIIKVLV